MNDLIISNPYFPIGIEHGKGLDYVATNLDPKDYKIQNVIDETTKFIQKLTDDKAKSNYLNGYKFIAEQLNAYQKISFQDFLKENKLHKESIFYVNEILNVSDELDYDDILKVLKNIEENILTSEMTIEEMQYPLLCVNVSIDSIKYWQRQIENPQTPWKPFIGNTKKFSWPWRTDAKGAVSGAIGGGISGGWVGAALGAVGGAVGSSVAEVLFPSKD